jgi:hypothetical protein
MRVRSQACVCALGRSSSARFSETRLRTAFPDGEMVAVGADLQITVQLRDPADAYPFLDRVRQTGATLVSLSIAEVS